MILISAVVAAVPADVETGDLGLPAEDLCDADSEDLDT